MNTDLETEKSSIEPIWCATANVKNEISFGEEHIIRKGTKHFAVARKFILPMLIGERAIAQM